MATDSAPLSGALATDPPARSGLRIAYERVRAYIEPCRRQVLGLILLLAAFCNFWELQRNGFANLYYSAAIRSMLESWHNFFFVAFDPGGFVTVDKPPLGFWIQAASAKIFGYSGFSILLPEALAGVLSVGVVYVLVWRIFGSVAGLLAALFLAITPISVVTDRNNTIDSLLVLTVLLGAYCVSRAAEHGGLRWLLLAAAAVGLGFNIKMLEAYLVVPAFGAAYLFGSSRGWWTRIWHLLVAGAAMLALSLAWVLAVDLTPASARPYVGSSGTNSELELAIGYNGLQRLLGNLFNFRSTGSGVTITNSAAGGPGGASENGAQGFFRLLDAQLGGQASWLLALGLIGLLAAGWGLRPRGFLRALPGRLRAWCTSSEARAAAHLSPQQTALVLWGLWTLTMAVFFSIAGFFHRYYLTMLAPGIAVLAGVGVVLMWRDHRASGWRGGLLPFALVATAVTQAIILQDYADYSRWMTPLIVVGSLAVAALLVWQRTQRERLENEAKDADAYALSPADVEGSARIVDAAPTLPPVGSELPVIASDAARAWPWWRHAPPRLSTRLARYASVPLLATILGVGLLLVGPTTWVGASLASGAGGTLPGAGPSTSRVAFTGGGFTGGRGGFRGGLPEGFTRPSGGFGGGGFGGLAGGGSGGGGAPTGSAAAASGDGLSVDSVLLKYLEANQGSAKYLFATTSSRTAAPYIIVSGKPVMALGGFSGSDQILTLSQLKALIREGQIRYFLLSGGGFGGGGGNSALISWIEANTTTVSFSAYGGSAIGNLYVVTSATLTAVNS